MSTVRIRQTKPMIIMLMIAFGIIAILGGTKFYKISKAIAANANHGPPPQAVTSMIATESTWYPTLDVVGSVSASRGVTISAEEDGKIVKIGVESGSQVKAGDLLLQQDTSVEEADLQAAQAKLDLARINLKRFQTLFAQSATSESTVNNAVSEAKATEGQVRAIQAVIAKKTVTAPFDGRAGIRMANEGEYLQKGASMVPLYALDPMFLDFTIPQIDVAKIKVNQEITFLIDSFADRKFIGKITAIDPQINSGTRNFRVQATVDNKDESLRPGMFAKVSILLGSEEKVIAIPGTSIDYAPYGNSVYIIEKMKNPQGGDEYLGVRQQFVQIGKSQGDLAAVMSGIKPGEEVVTSGIFKLRPGFPVIINNSVKPANDLKPNPEDT